MGEAQRLLAEHRADVADGLFGGFKRLRWSAERLAEHRQGRLRDLLTWSVAHSPFYRDHLAGVDPAGVTETGLGDLPPVTKAQLMAHFDDVVTDPELTLDRVSDHLDHLDRVEPGDGDYLLGRYRTLSTSGSSGQRGVFVYGWEDWTTFVVLQDRWALHPGRPPVPPNAKIASLYARKPGYVSGALHAFKADPSDPICHLPSSVPLDQVVATLNRVQPVRLQGYPTMLEPLLAESRAGRLGISPDQVATCGEQCPEWLRDDVRDTWGAEIDDIWGITEGAYAYPCRAGRAMHLPDDLVIVEPVDVHGASVPPGRPAAKIYLTNLYNRAQPLIRYEITDGMTLIDDPCPCGCAHRRIAALAGRLNDTFIYGTGLVLHPTVLCGPLNASRTILEYQIHQTERGATVTVRLGGPTDLAALTTELAARAAAAGLPDPEIRLVERDALPRLWSGKLRQYVPLGSSGPAR